MAGISVRDLLSGKETSEIALNKDCAERILKIDRSKYVVAYIQDKIVSLDQVTTGKVFFHYSKAEVLIDVLKAQDGLESIMKHAYASTGDNVAGNGFYLAGNPFSSKRYGPIQVSLKINPKARTLQLNIDDFINFVGNLSESERLSYICRDQALTRSLLQTLVLQENGVDLYLYDDPMMWYLLLNEDVVQGTDVIYPIRDEAHVIFKMSEAKRLDEIDVKLFKNEKPVARENMPFYSLEYALSQVCYAEEMSCYKEVLETLVDYRNYYYLDAFLALQHEYLDLVLSEVFNQELKKGNVANSEAILKISCKYQLQDFLIEKALWKYRKELKRKRAAFCQTV